MKAHSYIVVGFEVTRTDFFKPTLEMGCPKGHSLMGAKHTFCVLCGARLVEVLTDYPTPEFKELVTSRGRDDCNAFWEELRTNVRNLRSQEIGVHRIGQVENLDGKGPLAFGFRMATTSPGSDALPLGIPVIQFDQAEYRLMEWQKRLDIKRRQILAYLVTYWSI